MMSRRDGCIVSTTIEGKSIYFFVTNPTEEIQKYHYAGDFYEREELEIIRRYFTPGTIFVDIGANIGNHAIFAEKILDAPEVIVFEPNPAAIAHMEINLRLNDCQRINRNYLGFPVSDAMGQKMAITLSPSDNLGNTMFGASAEGTFETITGDSSLAHRPVGFIKIDTEEMEFQALEGLSATLSAWHPNLFVEVMEAREPELASWAADHGYRIAESQKRYHMARNYILTPNHPSTPQQRQGNSSVRQPALLNTLWSNINPYDGFNHRRFRQDLQGWNSHHIFFEDTLKAIRPSLVVEVGVWKGGSTIHMAKTAKELEIPTTIIAVDTWLGSWEHWEQPEWFPDLLFQNGYPSLYYTFLANVVEGGVESHVVPLPLDSANAAVVLDRKGIRPEMIHIDAGHDFISVTDDLKRWWSLLAPGGTLIADDYDQEGKVWPSVRDAVDAFLAVTPHQSFEAVPYKCRFVKPQ